MYKLQESCCLVFILKFFEYSPGLESRPFLPGLPFPHSLWQNTALHNSAGHQGPSKVLECWDNIFGSYFSIRDGDRTLQELDTESGI